MEQKATKSLFFPCLNRDAYLCPRFDFRTQLLVNLKRHTSSCLSKETRGSPNFRINIYLCESCGFETHSSLKWLKHVKSECSKEGPFEHVSQIGKGWELQFHTYSKQPHYYKCDFCPFLTKRSQYLRQHIMGQHTSYKSLRWYQCYHCSFRSKNQQLVLEHGVSKHGNKGFECHWCEFQATSSINLNKHLTRKHSFKCDQCPFKAVTMTKIRDHMIMTHINHKYIKGYIQNQKSATKSALEFKKNMILRHANWLDHDQNQMETENQLKEEKLIKCMYVNSPTVECSFRCETKAELKDHIMLKHSADKDFRWFECEYCDHMSRESYILSKHKVTNHPEIFPMQSQSNGTVQDHSEGDPLDVNTKSSLKTETMWPYSCGLCLFTTMKKSELRLHLITRHTKEKDIEWFYCEHCEYKAKLKKHLSIHQRRKHGFHNNTVMWNGTK